eukprot:g17936.t1
MSEERVEGGIEALLRLSHMAEAEKQAAKLRGLTDADQAKKRKEAPTRVEQPPPAKKRSKSKPTPQVHMMQQLPSGGSSSPHMQWAAHMPPGAHPAYAQHPGYPQPAAHPGMAHSVHPGHPMDPNAAAMAAQHRGAPYTHMAHVDPMEYQYQAAVHKHVAPQAMPRHVAPRRRRPTISRRTAERHVEIAYFIYYKHRQAMQGSQQAMPGPPAFNTDPTLEARRIRERSEWDRMQHVQHMYPAPAGATYYTEMGHPPHAMYQRGAPSSAAPPHTLHIAPPHASAAPAGRADYHMYPAPPMGAQQAHHGPPPQYVAHPGMAPQHMQQQRGDMMQVQHEQPRHMSTATASKMDPAGR